MIGHEEVSYEEELARRQRHIRNELIKLQKKIDKRDSRSGNPAVRNYVKKSTKR